MFNNIFSYDVNTNRSQQNLPVYFGNSQLISKVEDNNKQPSSKHKTKKNHTEEHKNKGLEVRILKIAMLTTLCVLIALKSPPKKLRSKLDQANKNLIDKNIKVGEGGKKGIMFHVRQGLRKMIDCSKAIFNLAPLKDVLLSKLMQKTRFTSNLAQTITNWFEKISFKTLRHSYSKTNEHLEVFFANCVEFNSKIPKEQAEIINAKIARIRELFVEGFSETARRKRLTQIKREFDGLDPTGTRKIDDSLMNKVWHETYQNLKQFMKKTAYTTFISEELATKTKIKYAREINDFKYEISNSLNTMCEDCFDLLIHIDTFIKPNDSDVRSIIKRIANQLKCYKKAVNDKKLKEQDIHLKGDIVTDLKQLDKALTNSTNYKKSIVERVSEQIKTQINRFENHKRGEINQIMKIYKEHLRAKDYEEISKIAYDTTNSIEKSVDMETNKMFEKVRDLKIGSAPKDVLILLVPLGSVGYGINKAKTSDEKISVAVKYGVPIAGAIAITMLCTIGLISAGPSLLIGAFSGLALNQIGVEVDNFIKRFKDK